MADRKKRNPISLHLKKEILIRFDKGEKPLNIASTMNLAASTIKTICCRDNEKIRKSVTRVEPSTSKFCLKTRSNLLEKIEKLLLVWLVDKNQRNLPLSRDLISEKALTLFYDIKLKLEDTSSDKFVVSRGWFNQFKNRTR